MRWRRSVHPVTAPHSHLSDLRGQEPPTPWSEGQVVNNSGKLSPTSPLLTSMAQASYPTTM
ncbi:hypothetical protein D623_10021503 [Myotis brandtii]|uniref:Uncharacterized protein n=1 Tax=Myotis brandtii TaxID=109478 RepID=S7QGF6_MYOBR|nr:hypothetical protein D623_10021503 [Myotis brandtii]